MGNRYTGFIMEVDRHVICAWSPASYGGPSRNHATICAIMYGKYARNVKIYRPSSLTIHLFGLTIITRTEAFVGNETLALHIKTYCAMDVTPMTNVTRCWSVLRQSSRRYLCVIVNPSMIPICLACLLYLQPCRLFSKQSCI